MLRTVLAVVLAIVIVGVVSPAFEDARIARSESQTETELVRLRVAATELAREQNVGARRTLELSVPDESVTRASVAFVALGGVPDGQADTDTPHSDRLAYRVEGGDTHVFRLPVDLLVAGENQASDANALVVHGGTVRLTLRLVRDGDRPVVAVEHSGSQ
ncbi:DUF7311 family protein [Halorussus halophilus]|uniref:DUF7311 family protein n=1 Tax=Halorussus halophilus TaxID=2650975 RepID=UPI001300E005|nr:hypothetical protein [Halorussus halophilus]